MDITGTDTRDSPRPLPDAVWRPAWCNAGGRADGCRCRRRRRTHRLGQRRGPERAGPQLRGTRRAGFARPAAPRQPRARHAPHALSAEKRASHRENRARRLGVVRPRGRHARPAVLARRALLLRIGEGGCAGADVRIESGRIGRGRQRGPSTADGAGPPGPAGRDNHSADVHLGCGRGNASADGPDGAPACGLGGDRSAHRTRRGSTRLGDGTQGRNPGRAGGPARAHATRAGGVPDAPVAGSARRRVLLPALPPIRACPIPESRSSRVACSPRRACTPLSSRPSEVCATCSEP